MNDKAILMGTDTISGVAPEILDSIISASSVKTFPYGNDIYTKECKEIICKVFEKENLEIIPMMSGTASNSLALSSFCNLTVVLFVMMTLILITMRAEPLSFSLEVVNY